MIHFADDDPLPNDPTRRKLYVDLLDRGNDLVAIVTQIHALEKASGLGGIDDRVRMMCDGLLLVAGAASHGGKCRLCMG